jgi:outer membrane receptor protein involved in Fe transport
MDLRLAAALSFCLGSTTAFAQAGADAGEAGLAAADISDVSLEALLETPVSFASATGTSVSLADAPGVVTVITREEIHDLGARDLIDVLRYVPGFDFTSDVEGAVGLAVRGISALEGKALVMLDGMPLNDLSYGNALFGNREAVDLIERIEIIRGPGSTVYGGFAELAVINIITHPDVGVNRVVANATYGQLESAVGHATGALQASHNFGDLNVRGSIYSGYTTRSDQPWQVGSTFVNMAPLSKIVPFNLSLAADWKGLSVQLTYDDYYVEIPVYDDLSQPLTKHHRNLYGSLKYSADLGSKVTLTAFARYQHQSPWESTTDFALKYGYYNNKPIDRILGGATLLIKPTGWLRLLAGVTATYDTSTVPPSTNPDVQIENTYYGADGITPVPSLSFFDLGAFAEAVVYTPVVNITAGARLDYHSQYGVSFVPRVALTKELGKFHAKALFAQAFRPPTFENFSLDAKVKPETTTVFEVEAGWQFLSWLYVGANVYDNRVRNVLVYQEDPVSGNSSYINSGTIGTHGVEVEAKTRGSWGYATLGYSFYQTTVPGVDQFIVTGRPDLNLGVPAHKFTARASFKINEHLAVNPALIVYSERYGLEPPLDGSDAVLTRFPPTALFDIFFLVKDAGMQGLDLSLGVHDLFGANYKFVPAYNAGINAMPGPGREVMLKLTLLRDFL